MNSDPHVGHVDPFIGGAARVFPPLILCCSSFLCPVFRGPDLLLWDCLVLDAEERDFFFGSSSKCRRGSGIGSAAKTSGCLLYLIILICLSIILPRGALIVMYDAIHAGIIQKILSVKLHVGDHGRLTYDTLNVSIECDIQLNIAMMKTIVNIMGLNISACVAIFSGPRDN